MIYSIAMRGRKGRTRQRLVVERACQTRGVCPGEQLTAHAVAHRLDDHGGQADVRSSLNFSIR
jgi:hypothetical protein